jgi:hypothetical protein
MVERAPPHDSPNFAADSIPGHACPGMNGFGFAAGEHAEHDNDDDDEHELEREQE